MFLLEIETNFILVSFKISQIEYDLTQDARKHLVTDLSKFLFRKTGIHWDFIHTKAVSTVTIAAERKEKKMLNEKKIDSDPSVIEIMRVFPGAKIGKSTFH